MVHDYVMTASDQIVWALAPSLFQPPIDVNVNLSKWRRRRNFHSGPSEKLKLLLSNDISKYSLPRICWSQERFQMLMRAQSHLASKSPETSGPAKTVRKLCETNSQPTTVALLIQETSSIDSARSTISSFVRLVGLHLHLPSWPPWKKGPGPRRPRPILQFPALRFQSPPVSFARTVGSSAAARNMGCRMMAQCRAFSSWDSSATPEASALCSGRTHTGKYNGSQGALQQRQGGVGSDHMPQTLA